MPLKNDGFLKFINHYIIKLIKKKYFFHIHYYYQDDQYHASMQQIKMQ